MEGWKVLWKQFCEKEYEKEKTLELFAVDCGGYDATDKVRIVERDGKIYLQFYSYEHKGSYETMVEKLIKEFEIIIKE